MASNVGSLVVSYVAVVAEQRTKIDEEVLRYLRLELERSDGLKLEREPKLTSECQRGRTVGLSIQ